MNARLQPSDTELNRARGDALSDERMKELIYEAMQIVAGESMMRATNDHLKALLEERTNIIASLYQTKDGLINACDALYGQDKKMAIAFLKDAQAQLQESGFLEIRDPDWVNKVLHGN